MTNEETVAILTRFELWAKHLKFRNYKELDQIIHEVADWLKILTESIKQLQQENMKLRQQQLPSSN